MVSVAVGCTGLIPTMFWQVNGSSIRAWWIRHHYWSIATCMIVLTLPVDSPAVQMFVKKWIWWCCWQVRQPGAEQLVCSPQGGYERPFLVWWKTRQKAEERPVCSFRKPP